MRTPYPFYNPFLRELMQSLPEEPVVREVPDMKHADYTTGSIRLFDYVKTKQHANPIVIVDDQTGEPCGWVSSDSVFKALFTSLQQSISFYEAVLNTVDDSITIVDEKGIVIGWNKQAETMYNIAPADIIGQHITRHFKEDAVMLLKSIHDGSSISQHYNQPREGTHVLVNTSPVVLDGRIIGSLSAEKDISDVVRLHDKLSSATAHLHDLEKEFYSEQQDQPFHRIKGKSITLQNAVNLAQKVAPTDATVLITGESGVGKELFAEAVHMASHRANKPFVALNCGAIPAALFESELFGYKKGAFTGAVSEGKKGKIDQAEGGTLFLDEIGELPLEQQVKLLRVLQEKQFYRVGGSEPIPANVRFIAATNRDLEAMVAAGQFRQDLFYRLNVVSISVPPLRERTEDIYELVHLFLKEFALKYNKPIPEVNPEVFTLFIRYPWPGNIRQLRNMVERLVILNDLKIEPEHLPEGFLPTITNPLPKKGLLPEPTLTQPLQPAYSPQNEYQELVDALRTTYGNKSAAAHLLGISRATLYNRLKKYGLDV
ncbi:sigma-54 interaction domain-containing protein [Aneurinibacillus terranovensis]|uniref:sigma-54 interaction domain-containing protein n=1 Tax=Aneurinibacillus terranovensis TaxID=278991 RepID=UPI001FE19360|nr:sigma 54-interacting transcriptional regulator [Aneurinibacillus terranovensis]